MNHWDIEISFMNQWCVYIRRSTASNKISIHFIFSSWQLGISFHNIDGSFPPRIRLVFFIFSLLTMQTVFLFISLPRHFVRLWIAVCMCVDILLYYKWVNVIFFLQIDMIFFFCPFLALSCVIVCCFISHHNIWIKNQCFCGMNKPQEYSKTETPMLNGSGVEWCARVYV